MEIRLADVLVREECFEEEIIAEFKSKSKTIIRIQALELRKFLAYIFGVFSRGLTLFNLFLELFLAFYLIILDIYPGLVLNEPVRSLVVHKVFDVHGLIFHEYFSGLEEVKYDSPAPNALIVLRLLL